MTGQSRKYFSPGAARKQRNRRGRCCFQGHGLLASQLPASSNGTKAKIKLPSILWAFGDTTHTIAQDRTALGQTWLVSRWVT